MSVCALAIPFAQIADTKPGKSGLKAASGDMSFTGRDRECTIGPRTAAKAAVSDADHTLPLLQPQSGSFCVATAYIGMPAEISADTEFTIFWADAW
jgi:hypothetical protein